MNIPNMKPLTPWGNPIGYMTQRNGEAIIVSLVFDARNHDGSNRSINMPFRPPEAIGFASQIIGAAIDASWTFGWNRAKEVLKNNPDAVLALGREEARMQAQANGQAAPAAAVVKGPAEIEPVEPAKPSPESSQKIDLTKASEPDVNGGDA
jgi:hypothetical protein